VGARHEDSKDKERDADSANDLHGGIAGGVDAYLLCGLYWNVVHASSPCDRKRIALFLERTAVSFVSKEE
jgi:hypothetical protein